MSSQRAQSPLRVVIYDSSAITWRRYRGLTSFWTYGAQAFRLLGWADAVKGAACWQEAIDWAAGIQSELRIGAIQFWGHGGFGQALIGNDVLDLRVFKRGHVLGDSLRRLRGRFLPDGDTLFWFRTCSTIAGERGRMFAKYWAKCLHCRTAGHTHIIWCLQSGLHVLAAGDEPGWTGEEGLTLQPGRKARARWSAPWSPQTITFLRPWAPIRPQ